MATATASTSEAPSGSTRAVRRARSRVAGLDSVRGVAVVAVVAYHLGFLSGGFLGVDLFFVLSGYLVTGLAIDEVAGTGRLGLRAFWGRRFRRLAPALLVLVPTVIAAALALDWPTDERRDLAFDGFASLTWWANWRQLAVPDGGYWSEVPSLFRHAWSLAIEEQFYVVWPLVLTAVVLMVRGRSNRARRIAIGVTAGSLAAASAVWSVVLATRTDAEDLSRVYLGSDTRAVAPLLGCFVAAVCWGRVGTPRRVRAARAVAVPAAVGLAALFATTEVSAASTYRHGLLPLAAALAAVVTIGASTVFRTDAASLWLGRRSYGLYLWSWPIQVLAEHRYPLGSRSEIALVTVALTVVVAEASHRFVEQPVQRSSSWASHVAVRRLSGGFGCVAAVGVLLLASTSATEKPVHERLDAADSLELALGAPPTTADPGAAAADGERVMIVGDSVAFTAGLYGPEDPTVIGLESIDNRAVIGCGVLAPIGFRYPNRAGDFVLAAGGDCQGQEEAIDRGLSGRPSVLLLLPGAWEHSDVQSPGRRRIEARSPTMERVLRERFLDLAERADDVGARTVLLQWACPGPDTDPRRSNDEFIEWFDNLLDDVAEAGREQGLDIESAPPPKGVCVDDDPTAAATKAKNEALDDEVHASTQEGGLWWWKTWLLPAIESTTPTPPTN